MSFSQVYSSIAYSEAALPLIYERAIAKEFHWGSRSCLWGTHSLFMLIHTVAINRGAHTNIVQVHTMRNALQARLLRLNDALRLLRNLHF